ncbi:MAG: ABC transporter permease subunit [Woeseiaceae bacterium]|nr:ABC transporter permease subunit [Woeseiaceae bacterium]
MSDDNRSPFPFRLLRFWTLRILPAWCLIAFMIFLFQIAICGVVHDNERVKALLQYIDMLPDFIKAFMGGEVLQVGNVAGLIAIGYQDPFVLLLYMLYAVGVPTALLAGEIQRGTMELILSRQTTKTHVYICAGFITVAGMYALVLVMFMGTVAATNLYQFDQEVPLYSFFKIAINGGMLASAVGGIALLAAACFHRGLAVSLTVGYLVVSYFISIIAEWWPRMKWLEPTTIFNYVDGPAIFGKSGWPIGDMCVLLSLLAVSTVLGGVIWSRRDLPL